MVSRRLLVSMTLFLSQHTSDGQRENEFIIDTSFILWQEVLKLPFARPNCCLTRLSDPLVRNFGGQWTSSGLSSKTREGTFVDRQITMNLMHLFYSERRFTIQGPFIWKTSNEGTFKCCPCQQPHDSCARQILYSPQWQMLTNLSFTLLFKLFSKTVIRYTLLNTKIWKGYLV